MADITHRRFRGEPPTFVLEVVEPAATAARVRDARAHRGSTPIGCIVRDEADALSALQEGADEASVLAVVDERSVHAFVDRMLLRASLRKRDEGLSAAIGHAEKLAALGTLVAGVAHEINNPLGALMLSVNMIELSMDPLERGMTQVRRLADLGRPVQPEELGALVDAVHGRSPRWETRSLLVDINGAIDTITHVVRDLKVFARADEKQEAELVDVTSVIDQVLRIVRRDIEQSAVLERDLDTDLPPVIMPRTRLTQVLTNVLVNASHAVREVSRPVHRVRVSTRADEESVAIIVSDTGPGIAPADVERIFDPFYTTKRQDFGTGLGLSISRSILRELGGDLLVESIYGTGAQFIIYLPLPEEGDPRAAAAIERARILPTHARRLTVLVIDDDEGMLRAYGRALGPQHDIVIAADAEEAIALLSTGTVADVVLAEVFLGGMDGFELYEWIEQERPKLSASTLFVTARTTAHPTCRKLEEAGAPVLTKPIDRATLVERVSMAASR